MTPKCQCAMKLKSDSVKFRSTFSQMHLWDSTPPPRALVLLPWAVNLVENSLGLIESLPRWASKLAWLGFRPSLMIEERTSSGGGDHTSGPFHLTLPSQEIFFHHSSPFLSSSGTGSRKAAHHGPPPSFGFRFVLQAKLSLLIKYLPSSSFTFLRLSFSFSISSFLS